MIVLNVIKITNNIKKVKKYLLYKKNLDIMYNKG